VGGGKTYPDVTTHGSEVNAVGADLGPVVGVAPTAFEVEV